MQKASQQILAVFLSFVMTLSLLPVQALAADPGLTEEASAQTLLLPIVQEGEEGPEPQGGSVSTFALTSGEAYVNYAYAGDSSMRVRQAYILDPDSGERMTQEPEKNGILQLLDENGKVVASSDAISYYSSDYTDDTYYISGEYLRSTETVPAGSYRLQLAAGNTVYPCEGTLVVVGTDALLLTNAYINELYPGASEFEVSLTLQGFETEAELDGLSLQLLDESGTVVAQSAGAFRDFSIYKTQWHLYAQMAVVEGQTIAEDTEYSLKILYTGQKPLYDGAGSVTRTAYTPSVTIEDFQTLDAQTATVSVTLGYLTAGVSYRVTVGYNDEIYAEETVTAQGESAEVVLQLKQNGLVRPLTTYKSRFDVDVFREDETWHSASANYDNPYYNLDGQGYIQFYPYYVKPTAGQIAFRIEFSNGCSYWQGTGDVLSLRDADGREVGRCDALTLTLDGSQGVITGTLTISENLSAKNNYGLYLNGVQFDTVWVTEEPQFSMTRIPMSSYSDNTFWTNLGCFPVSTEAFNCTGLGRFSLGSAVSSGNITGEDCGLQDTLAYSWVFSADDLAGLTSGEAYDLSFSCGGQSKVLETMTYVGEKTPLDWSDSRQGYISWSDLTAGSKQIEAVVYCGSDDGPKNITMEELEASVKQFSLSNGKDVFHVSGYTDGTWENNYYFYRMLLTLDQPLTAGTYTASWGETELESGLSVSASTANKPDIWGDAADGYLTGRYLPSGSSYTARIYSGYAAKTAEFSLRLQGSNSSSQYLYFDKAVLSGLAAGSYEMRVYMDGKLLDSVSLTIRSATQPIITLNDEDDDWEDQSDLVMQVPEVRINVANIGAYSYLRWAETEDALAKETFRTYFPSYYYGHTFEGEDGPRKLYVELSKTGQADDGENLRYSFDLWLWTRGDYGLQVPAEIQGVQDPSNGSYVITATTLLPAARLWVDFFDADGSHASQQMTYAGPTEDGRYQFKLAFGVDGSSSFYDYASYNGRFYYKDTQSIRVFSTDLSDAYHDGEPWRGNVVGQPVERILVFGDPDYVILPQFAKGALLTNQSSFTVYGYAAPDSKVTLSEGGSSLGTAATDTYGYFSIPLTGLAEGAHTITAADVKDTVGSREATLIVDRTAPTITAVAFTFLDGDNAVLRWECADTDVDYFQLFKNNTPLAKVSGTDRSYNVLASADDGNTFTVIAVDLAGNRSSKTVSTADTEPPTAPTGLALTGRTTTTLSLSWTAGTDNMGVAGYNVYQAGEEIALLTGEDTAYTVTGLEQGTSYSFTVKTRDKAGNLSEESRALAAATVKLSLEPGEPETLLVADAYAGKRIPVKATVTADDESYAVQLASAQLEYRAAGQEDWQSGYLSVSGAAVSGNWTISGDEDGYLPMGDYELRITAVDSHGAAVTGDVISVTLKRDDEAPTVPGAPVADSHSTTSITFHWDPSTDNVAVDHYEIWRGNEKAGESKTASYTDTGLAMATAYAYTVKAVDARGNTSAASAASSLSTAKLEFDSKISLDSSYLMEEQTGKKIAVWARFKPEAGYAPDVSMRMEFKLADSQTWNAFPLSSSRTDSDLFSGSWDLSGDETGYLPAGTYQVRFAVSDSSASAYSEEQTVVLKRDDIAPEVTVLTPADTTVGGKSVQLHVRAEDNVGVVRIALSYAAQGETVFTAIGEIQAGSGDLTWSAGALASGTYTVKAEAYDLMSNKGEKTVELTIDNTPPAVPGSFTVTGTSRYIHVMWDPTYQQPSDFFGFRVYRSERPDGGFACVETLSTIGYFDSGRTAEVGKTYYYYVTAVDAYGNESGYDAIASATLVADSESPVIGDMLPNANALLRRSAVIKVTASDNYRLAKAVFSYRPAGTQDWIVMGEKAVSEVTNRCVFSYSWAIPEDLSGSCELRVQVYDDSINDVEAGSGFTANAPAEQTVTVTIKPYSAPVAPVVTAAAGYKTAQLSWTYSGDPDTLRHFNVYQVKNGQNTYVTSVKAGASGSCTAPIPSSGTQSFIVEAEDKYGAKTSCQPVSVTSLARENVPPVARIAPETLTAAAGHPFTFSGLGSTDNDEIVSYAWDFGDNSSGTGARCEHTYAAAGTYTVRLTVTDASGNTDTAEATMNVYEVGGETATHALMTVKVVNAYEAGTPAVAGADLQVTTVDGFSGSALTGEDGTASFMVPLGACTVSVTAGGYLSTSRPITVIPAEDGTFTCTIGITPMNASMVEGSLTADEMTYDEILAAGIDVEDPDNNHVWKFEAELEFVAAPAFPFDLPSLPLTGYYNEAGNFVGNGTGWGWNYIGGGGGNGTGWGMNVGVFPISEHFILVIYGEAHWLKEMYNVELLVINNSYTDDITDCAATLALPEGLSLPATGGSAQDPTITLGTIGHKTSQFEGLNANTAKANWYVRGDAEGEYALTATVTGRNPDPFVKTFTTDQPVKVYAGSALKLHITAEDIAYRGDEYHVRFQLENVSHKALYNLSFGITGADQFKVLRVGDKTADIPLTHEDFEKNMTSSIDSLEPGGTITIDFFTTSWFNSALELADLGPMDVGYYLTGVFVTTLEGSSTSIPYDVTIRHARHGTFYEWLLEDVGEDTMIDLLDKNFTSSVPIVKTGVKVYKFVTKDHSDAASRAVITIEGGSFTASNNFLRSFAQPSGAVSVYTDAPEGSYEISADGKTMTVTGSAAIYVQGENAGEATMTVTTYTETADGGFEPNVYTMTYMVSGAAGTAEEIILQAPRQSEVEVPLAGKTSQVTFPHALKDASGALLSDAANAQWTLTGGDTTGLSLEKGVLTIDSSAKAGTYTVRLAISGTDQYAEQTITLIRQASVPTALKLFRDGEELLSAADTLVLPVTGEARTYTYTATLLDQYGVDMDSSITWTTSDNTSGVQQADGKIVLTRDTAVGSLTLTAAAGGMSVSVTVTVTALAVDWSGVDRAIAGTRYIYGDPNGKAALPSSGTAAALKTVSGTFSYADGETVQNAGQRTITVVFTVDAGDETYGGTSITRDITISIGKKPLSDGMISVSGRYTYSGSDILPTYTVADGDLLKPSDVQVRYADNRNAGTASILVTAAEDGNYTGTASASFLIDPKTITEADFTTLGTATLTYTGSLLTQTIVTALTDSDYEVIYANNTNAGTASYTITGKANYTGSFEKQFTIAPAVVTVTPNAGQSKVYGSADPLLSYVMTPGTLAVGNTMTGALSRAEGENAGTYAITLGTLSAGSNYSVVLDQAAVSFTITAAAYDLTKLPTTLYIGSSYTPATISSAVKNAGVVEITAIEVQKSDGTIVTGSEADAIAAFDPATGTIKAVGAGKVIVTYAIEAKDMNGDGTAEYSAVSGEKVTLTLQSAPSGGGGGGGGGGMTAPAKPVSPKQSENGTVSVDTDDASSGETVTITVTPDEGYELDEIIVTDKNGKRIPVTGKNGKYTFVMPNSEVTIQSVFKPAAQTSFTDVPADAYYRDALLWAVRQGITLGTSATAFSPNDGCTRAQIITFLWRAAGSPEPVAQTTFTDVAANSYYAKAVAWAVEQGITTGTGYGQFAPDALCTRAQAVTFLWRSQKSPTADSVSPFTDVAADAYYRGAVLWAVKRGVTLGTSATTFSPDDRCTRAQIVTFLYRCMK